MTTSASHILIVRERAPAGRLEPEPARPPAGHRGGSDHSADIAASRPEPPLVVVEPRWLAIFEDRYGVGSAERLVRLLALPCISFADIGVRFGVTRERVRQWHLLLLPDAPRGHARQQFCRRHRHKQRLLADPLFSSFYGHARTVLGPGRVRLIRSSAGFHRRLVHIDQHLVALSDARAVPAGRTGIEALSYRLTRSREPADFVYYRLQAGEYLFLSANDVPARGAANLAAIIEPYRNTFGAISRADHSSRAPRQHVRSGPAGPD